MPQLLLELFSEEIPARMQANAARDLERLFGERLKEAGLAFASMQAFAGPRRLALAVEGLPVAQEDRAEERKGPRANAPDQAIEGFLRSTGLSREQLEERDGVLFARIDRKGRKTAEIIAESVDQVVRNFPWPKSMTWGRGTLRWVRPLQGVLCVLDGKVVEFEIDGVVAGDETRGHRFMGTGHAFKAHDLDAYRKRLADHYVVLDAEDRKAIILDKARAVCADAGVELVDDIGLLDEVAGLAEWPTPILGEMDPTFLDLPAEVIRTSMRTHQKYFAVSDPRTGKLAPNFITVANIEASDGGTAVAAGNARVLSARLNDARFFWDHDREVGNFDRWLKKLEGVTFHAKLGTMAQRVDRLVALARQLAPLVGADPDKAAEAARLAKADLASGMVGEFPELQGVMGGYYARETLLDAEIADAVRDHYRPQGPGDAVPTGATTVAVALADKIDSLVGFFSIDERPTGSRDPFALRRFALGIIRTVLEGRIRLPLINVVAASHDAYLTVFRNAHSLRYQSVTGSFRMYDHEADIMMKEPAERDAFFYVNTQALLSGRVPWEDAGQTMKDQFDEEAHSRFLPFDEVREALRAFFADRFKVLLRDQGERHDLVDAVFALGDDDLVRVAARVKALDRFLSTDDGTNLLAGYRRATNILKAETKKTELFDSMFGAFEPSLEQEEAETHLRQALTHASLRAEKSLADEDFETAMSALASLRPSVDHFFDKVLVNAPDEKIRINRLRLLNQLREVSNRVADFSLITG